MPSAAALVSIFGPLLEIGSRVLLVMVCGLLVLVAVRMSGRAIGERCAARLSAAARSTSGFERLFARGKRCRRPLLNSFKRAVLAANPPAIWRMSV
jgi:hypothetical protein